MTTTVYNYIINNNYIQLFIYIILYQYNSYVILVIYVMSFYLKLMFYKLGLYHLQYFLYHDIYIYILYRFI